MKDRRGKGRGDERWLGERQTRQRKAGGPVREVECRSAPRRNENGGWWARKGLAAAAGGDGGRAVRGFKPCSHSMACHPFIRCLAERLMIELPAKDIHPRLGQNT